MIRARIYRSVMKLAHRFDWHYMPKCYPDGDTMVWCRWCGVRDVINRKVPNPAQQPQAQAAEGGEFGGGDVQDGGSWS